MKLDIIPTTDEESYEQLKTLPESQRYIDEYNKLRASGLSVVDAVQKAVVIINKERFG